MGVLSKAVRVLRGGYSPMQMLQRINRSPARHVVKAGASAFHLSEKRQRREAAKHFQEMNGGSVADELRSLGYTYRIQMDPALTSELISESLALRNSGTTAAKTHKEFIDRPLDPQFEQGSINENSIWVRYALQPSILAAVTNYLGEIPYLNHVVLTDSMFVGEDYQVSQLWHRDYDDVSMVKLFAYLTDVNDVGDGPFHFIPTGPSRKAKSFASAHMADEQVFRSIPRSVTNIVVGKAGTAFMVDTSKCLHMGSRIANGRQRMLYTACYLTVPTIYPNFINRIAVTDKADSLTKMLLTW